MAYTMMLLRFLTSFRLLEQSICPKASQSDMVQGRTLMPEESKENTCVLLHAFQMFFFSFFHQLLSNIMKLSRLLLSSQDSHPGIKLLVLLGSLGSFDLILFCCFHFIYLHLLLTVTFIHVQSAPSLLLPQPQAVVMHYFSTCLNSKKWIFWTAGHLKAVLEKVVTWWGRSQPFTQYYINIEWACAAQSTTNFET